MSLMLDVTEGEFTVYFSTHLCPFSASWVIQIDSDSCSVPTYMASILQLSVSSIESVLSNDPDTLRQISFFSYIRAFNVTINKSDI